ncbi:MAG: DUF4157 domain-containing protein [Chloroflexi bacterium]|nr:DUF4157 domain-containing protein [Chloroflexota bacterium]
MKKLMEFLDEERRARALEDLWTFLLFKGNLPFMAAIEAKVSAMAGKKPRRSSGGRFAKLAAFAKGVGLDLLDGFLDFRNAMQVGMIGAQQTVVRYPRLRRLIQAVPALLEVAVAYGPKVIDAAEALGDLYTVRDSIEKQLQETLDELFVQLNALTLPEQIIPMAMVFDVIIDLFLGSLGVKGKILRKALDAPGARDAKQWMLEKIAEELEDVGVDPNILWREFIKTEVEALLSEARDAITDGVNAVLDSLFDGAIRVGHSQLDAPKPAFASDEPELDALLEDEASDESEEDEDIAAPAYQRAPRVEFNGGVPISPAARLRYERAFGHDFTHVRLHADRSAHRLTEHYGARALTSGSHVFLSENLAPGSAAADPVLRHELAHVLQQTGARPLDLPASRQPRPGRAHVGLQVNSRREDAAERMARLTHHRLPNEPVPVEEEGGMGLLPSLGVVARRLIAELDNEKLAEDYAAKIDAITKKQIPKALTNKAGWDSASAEAAQIWTEAKQFLTGKRAPADPLHGHKSPFDDPKVAPVLETLFDTSVVLTRLRTDALAFQTHMNAGKRKKITLDRSRYIAALARYIYGKTGLIVDIDKIGATVAYARVAELNLAILNRSTSLWKLLVAQTNDYMKTPAAGGPFKDLDRGWAIVRSKLDSAAYEKEPLVASTAPANSFRLGDAFIQEMREALSIAGKVNISDWSEYINPATLKSNFGGLRVATHGQLTGSAKAGPPLGDPGAGALGDTAQKGRESHHVPQYLLVEYFRNHNESVKIVKSVEGKMVAPPGLEPATGIGRNSQFDQFQSSAGGVNLHDLDPTAGRGDRLPAISLMAGTHQRGRLHVNSASNFPSGQEIDAGMSQSKRIDTVFYGFLADATGLKGSAEQVLKSVHGSPDKYKPFVLQAMKKTYGWMYNMMIGALRTALEKEEIQLYEEAALALPSAVDPKKELLPAYKPKASDTAKAFAAIEDKNKIVMASWK